MRILIINADCVLVNSSANLCHLAYLEGLVAAGHQVELLSAGGEGRVLDAGMRIPPEITRHSVNAISLYERLSIRKHGGGTAAAVPQPVGAPARRVSPLRQVISAAKGLVLRLYGAHGIYATFVRKAARIRFAEPFDVVISLSTPVASHAAAHKLIQSKHLKTARWIQIWEDPWFGDVYSNNGDKTYREEARLLRVADRICYVSPLTLENQRRLFPEAADKMYWQPLPHYYEQDSEAPNTEPKQYGYFGNYYPAARDLEPFYRAAVETGIRVNICGDPAGLFQPTEQIHIHPRLRLDQLKPIEDSTNVLVFLCNRKGGQIPGKIYQYSATSKVILFIMDGTEEEKRVLRAFFQPFHRYIFCENTAESIAAAIRRIEAGDFGDVKQLPLAAFDPVKIIQNILNCGE